MRKMLSAALAALSICAATPVAAADLVIEGGVLTGATGVNVGGTLYDVTFVDGTCASVYGTCAASAFDFTTKADAAAATTALMTQVFLGIYDSNPEKTFGCADPTECAVYVAYGLTTFTSGQTAATIVVFGNWNAANDQLDAVLGTGTNTGTLLTATDTSVNETNIGRVYARFALQSAPPVPEPATWAMMLLGFGAIGFATRRRQQKGFQYA